MLLKKNFFIFFFLLFNYVVNFSAKNNDKKYINNKKNKIAKKLKIVQPFKDIPLKEMAIDQLNEVLIYSKKMNKKDLQLLVLQNLINKSKDKSAYIFELANLYFELGNIEEAITQYEKFITDYPGSNENEFSNYKLINAKYLITLPATSDSRLTEEVIELCNEFLKKAKNIEYIIVVKDILYALEQKLFEHEVHILEQYIREGAFLAAENRFKAIIKKFASKAIKNYDKKMAILLDKMLDLELISFEFLLNNKNLFEAEARILFFEEYFNKHKNYEKILAEMKNNFELAKNNGNIKKKEFDKSKLKLKLLG